MKIRLLILASVALLVMLIIAGSCTRRLLTPEPAGIWTPAPISGAAMTATRPAAILPPLSLQAATRPTLSTPIPTIPSTVVSAPTPGPLSQPNPDPHLVIITKGDILNMIASGKAGQSGASVEGASVDFTNGKMIFSATRLTYGAIEVRNFVLVGRLVADQGQLRLETESITPRGLVTALIPSVANQALTQYTSQWHIEEVRTLDERLELRVR